MSLTEPLPKHRYLGIDVVRTLSFIAITIHHFVWVLWYKAPPEEQTNAGWFWFSAYARAISFSGHTIIFLSTYLIARTQTRVAKTWKIVGLVTFGWFVFCLFEWGQNPVFWIWDVYPLIALGLATALVARQISTKLIYALGVIGFAMTWVDFWNVEFFQSLSLQWRHWWIGDCTVDLADWPILPWIGILWTPYALGTWDSKSKGVNDSSRFGHWRKWEWVVWPLLMIPAIPQLGSFYHITLGPMFACFSFRQEPYVFWSNFVFVIFLLRISLLVKVQERLSRVGFVRVIGSLRINQSFGVAYLIHYTLIEGIVHFMRPTLAPSTYLPLVAMIAILPLTEISVRGLEALVSRLRKSPSSPAA